MHQVCLAKNNAQEHFTFELKIKSHGTTTRSTFDARQNFVSRHICRDSSGSDTRLSLHEFQVTSWYCRFRTGSRVVGMCSLINYVLWHYDPHLAYDITDWKQYLQDAKNLPQYAEHHGCDSSQSSNDGCV